MSSQRTSRAPVIAALIKLAFGPVFKRAANQVLKGRYLDREDHEKGRFTQSDVNRILEKTWRAYAEWVSAAQMERLRTLGNRQNVLLGVATYAMYKTLLDEGVQKAYSTELVTDVAWKGYETWIVLPRFIARLLTRDPQKQMELMLRMFLRYPFNRPGYDWQIRPKLDSIELDFYRCPVHDYFKGQGEEEAFRNSWCTLDYALAQVMTKGGYYERPQTLSAGDGLCSMRWYGKPKAS